MNDDLDLRNVLLLDNQSTFDLCCNKNKKFTSQVTKAPNALTMTSNGDGEEEGDGDGDGDKGGRGWRATKWAMATAARAMATATRL